MKRGLSFNEIRKLYYQEGLSTPLIAIKTRSSIWQIIKFMKNHDLPRRSSADSNHIRFLKQKPSFNLKSTLTTNEEELKLAACMLYWAEGVKGNSELTVDFANSDPKMILIFLKFLRLICGVKESKLRILLYCYANQDVEKLTHYWSTLTSIPKEQFQTPYIRKDFKQNGRKMVNGLVHIRYNDKKLFWQIKKWIEGYKRFKSWGGRAAKCTSL